MPSLDTSQNPGAAARPRLVLWMILGLAGIGVGSLASFFLVAHLHPQAGNVPAATSTKNSVYQARNLATPTAAAAGLLDFLPIGDRLTIQAAVADATGHGSGRFSGKVEATPLSNGRYQITIRIPVNLEYLRRTGEISLGAGPGASDLATGQLLVNGTNHVWSVTMDPKTHVALFQYELARNDLTLWPAKWICSG